MTDIHDLRAQMREGRGARPVVVQGGGFKIPFGLVAGTAVALGFLLVLFTPKIYSVQRTAALPAFKDVKPEPAPVAAAPHPGAVVPPAAVKPNYAGKGADEAARIADAVCEQRLTAAPQRGQAAVEAKLHCFLSEGTARFCTGSQARKATADIINYFKGIEYTNAAVVVAAKVAAMKPSGEAAAVLNKAEIDPRVVEAIEGVIRAGYLTKANRDEIGANVPRELKDRFARIVGSTPPCPKPPWWAVWK